MGSYFADREMRRAIELVCRVTSCVSGDDFDALIALARNMDPLELRAMYDDILEERGQAGVVPTPVPGRPSRAPAVPPEEAEGGTGSGTGTQPAPAPAVPVPPPAGSPPGTPPIDASARVRQVLCSPVTRVAIAGLGLRYPPLAQASAVVELYCDGGASWEQLVRALGQMRDTLGGGSAPMPPQLGAGGALLSGVDALVNRRAGAARQLEDARIAVHETEPEDVITVLNRNPRFDTMPFSPLGSTPEEARAAWAMLEAAAQGGRPLSTVLTSSSRRTGPLTVDEVAALAAAVIIAPLEPARARADEEA